MVTESHECTVEFWFDPGCPHTWRTSRWLSDVVGRRGVDVHWRLMSLTVLNEGRERPAEYWERRRQADRALRVLPRRMLRPAPVPWAPCTAAWVGAGTNRTTGTTTRSFVPRWGRPGFRPTS